MDLIWFESKVESNLGLCGIMEGVYIVLLSVT